VNLIAGARETWSESGGGGGVVEDDFVDEGVVFLVELVVAVGVLECNFEEDANDRASNSLENGEQQAVGPTNTVLLLRLQLRINEDLSAVAASFVRNTPLFNII